MRRPVKSSRKVSDDKFVRLVRILDRWVPTDAPTGIIPVTSLRGVKGLRVSGTTEGRGWSVELYGGNFYLVKIDGLEARDVRAPLHVLNFLRANLLPPRTPRVRVLDLAP